VAEKLAAITPGKLKKSFFTTDGTGADETAILLAKIYTGSQEIVVLRHGYAGRSLQAIAITGHAPWRLIPAQVPGIKHGHPAYCYRCPFGLTYPDCEVKCAQDMEELIRTETNGKPAAFMAEPIQGVGVSSASTAVCSSAMRSKRDLAAWAITGAASSTGASSPRS